VHGARYTPKGGFGSIYLASDPITALKEVVAVIETPYAPAFTLRTHPWAVFAVGGVLCEILDLADDVVQSALGTTLAELTGDWAITQAMGQVPPTQSLGQAAYDCKAILGFRYPSVKNLGKGIGLVVFADRLKDKPPSFLEVYDPYLGFSQRLP